MMRFISFRGLAGLWTVLVLMFLIVPLLVILPIAFSSDSFLSYPLPGYSLRWFGEVTREYPWMFALKNSLIVGVATVIIAVPLGTLAAYGLVAKSFPGKTAVHALMLAPMLIPVVITGLGSFFFMSRIGLHGTYSGLVMSHVVLALPFVVIPVSATLKGYDQNLTRAAANLGATPFSTFFTVTMPLIMPGVITGAVFAFITSFDEVVVALFVSSPSTLTLPRQLFSGLRDQLNPSLVAIALVLIVASCVLLILTELLRPRSVALPKE